MSGPNIVISPEKFQIVPNVNEDCTIELTNVGFQPVIYRVLTTAPQRYLVKGTKGVIKASATARVTVTLNTRHLRDMESTNTAGVRDDFRVDYALLGEKDVVEPRNANVPNLLRDKKAADPAAVQRKIIRCQVVLDPAARGAASSRSGGGAAPEAPAAMAAAAAAAGMTPEEMQRHTLDEKKRRQEVHQAAGSKQGGSRDKLMILAVVLALVAGLWLMS